VRTPLPAAWLLRHEVWEDAKVPVGNAAGLKQPVYLQVRSQQQLLLHMFVDGHCTVSDRSCH